MEDTKDRRIKAALYTAVLNKLSGKLSELEAKEVLLTNAPTYITSKDHDHADHIEELKNIIVRKVEIKILILTGLVAIIIILLFIAVMIYAIGEKLSEK